MDERNEFGVDVAFTQYQSKYVWQSMMAKIHRQEMLIVLLLPQTTWVFSG